MTKAEFIETLGRLAQAECAKRSLWVLPSVCIGQAALETGWGRSSLMVKANAFFGIKAGSSWKGKVYSARTQECYDGVNYTEITDVFRAYDSLEESVSDYYDLLTKSSRYAAACNVTDAEQAITAIKNGGYATSPTYIVNVMNVIKSNNLTAYDAVVINSKPKTDLKSIEEVALEVMAGKWGNGTDRKQRLTAAGYNYSEVQQLVNQLAAAGINDKPATTQVQPDRARLISIAQKYIGCNEANGTHKKIIDIYNNHKPLARGYKVKYTDAWCATFASAVAIEAGLTDIIPTECGCEPYINLFIKMGCWEEDGNKAPEAGDYIFYNWDDSTQPNDGRADHVGIVENVSGNTITVIEGNYSNSVKRRTLKVGNGYIRGYGKPKYSSKAAVNEKAGEAAVEQTPTPAKQVHKVVKGDTLSALARKYNTTVAQILKDNKEKYPSIKANYIVTGWQLTV